MPFNRPCIGVDDQPCPTKALTADRSGRCEPCRRRHWTSQGTNKERGYGADHVALRAAWRPLVEAGRVLCWRCGELIAAGDPWDLGHSDTDRSVYMGPEHRAHNRATNTKGRR
jgi:hypothetical protein